MDSPLCKLTAEAGRIPKPPLEPPKGDRRLVEYVEERGYTQVLNEIAKKRRVSSIKGACGGELAT